MIQILDKNILYKNRWNTFWKVVAGLIMAGKNNGGDKYGGLADNPPHYPRHIFTRPNTIFRPSTFFELFKANKTRILGTYYQYWTEFQMEYIRWDIYGGVFRGGEN